MNRKQKLLVGAALPALLAVGIAAGVALAQVPDEERHGDGVAMDMGGMMDSATMQEHMKAILGEDGYQGMLDAMAQHASGMPMDMSGMGNMATAMEACLGGAAPGPGDPAHSEHHPGGTG